MSAGPSARTRHLALRTGADLAVALDRGLLTAVYQPVVDVGSGQVVAAEALARLRDPGTNRLVPPADFVALAEATGMVDRLDRELAALAIPQAAAWRRMRPGQPFSIAVNISVHDLDDNRLPDRLATLAAAADLPLNALIVEVTETALSVPDPRHADVLRRLDAMEVNVTLDDFGTGFSSLSQLLRYPIHGIKVDRSFVAELGNGGRGERIARSVIRLGADIGVHVVAEGVETEQQLEILGELGCPFAQGFLFGRPVPAAELTARLGAAGPAGLLPRPRLAAAE